VSGDNRPGTLRGKPGLAEAQQYIGRRIVAPDDEGVVTGVVTGAAIRGGGYVRLIVRWDNAPEWWTTELACGSALWWQFDESTNQGEHQ
jgi:hypothetical protein